MASLGLHSLRLQVSLGYFSKIRGQFEITISVLGSTRILTECPIITISTCVFQKKKKKNPEQMYFYRAQENIGMYPSLWTRGRYLVQG